MIIESKIMFSVVCVVAVHGLQRITDVTCPNQTHDGFNLPPRLASLTKAKFDITEFARRYQPNQYLGFTPLFSF